MTTSSPRSAGPTYRLVGAGIAGAIGIGAMVVAYGIAGDARVDAVLHLRQLMDRSGFGGNDLAGGLLWSVAPLSAAWAALLMTPRAIAADRWAGAVMGGLTYILACVLGSFIVIGALTSEVGVVTPPTVDPIGTVFAAIFWIGLVAVLLYPLLLVCLVSGELWAMILRAVGTSWLGVDGPGRHPFPGALIALSLGVLGVGWLVLIWIAGLFVGDPNAID